MQLKTVSFNDEIDISEYEVWKKGIAVSTINKGSGLI